jgi:hypothetical protein
VSGGLTRVFAKSHSGLDGSPGLRLTVLDGRSLPGIQRTANPSHHFCWLIVLLAAISTSSATYYSLQQVALYRTTTTFGG